MLKTRSRDSWKTVYSLLSISLQFSGIPASNASSAGTSNHNENQDVNNVNPAMNNVNSGINNVNAGLNNVNGGSPVATGTRDSAVSCSIPGNRATMSMGVQCTITYLRQLGSQIFFYYFFFSKFVPQKNNIAFLSFNKQK